MLYKLDGVAPLVADPPDAIPPLGKINLFQIHYASKHQQISIDGAA